MNKSRLISRQVTGRDPTGLLATGFANADSRNELAASRARIVMAADEARRRFERDFHDGAQQRIVLLALELQNAEAMAPEGHEAGINGRFDEGIEVAAYYVVSEALANAAKHADASMAELDVRARNGILDLVIHDTGIGGADPAGGSGLMGLKDRVEALAGTMTVVSPIAVGTSIHVEPPVGFPASPLWTKRWPTVRRPPFQLIRETNT
jgi:signal transduction histidine kinase